MSVLDVAKKEHVFFDENNPDHIQAFLSLHRLGRQHPTLRFVLEEDFLSVYHMMINRMVNAYANLVLGNWGIVPLGQIGSSPETEERQEFSKIALPRMGLETVCGQTPTFARGRL